MDAISAAAASFAAVSYTHLAGAKLLIAADCTAYAYANFHQEFMRGKVTLIGCPKLDAVDYSEKLTEILRSNDIQSVTILRMEVDVYKRQLLEYLRSTRQRKETPKIK